LKSISSISKRNSKKWSKSSSFWSKTIFCSITISNRNLKTVGSVL